MLRATAVTMLLLTCAAPAWAQPAPAPARPTEAAIDEAREHLKRANVHFEAGDFKLALEEFERAYGAAPNYKILFNIGQVNLQLNRYAAALAAFERYLADGGDAIEADRAAAVADEVARLRGRTGTLMITSNVDAAEVRIDGVVVGATPLAGIRVDAGRHDVILTKDGRSTTQTVAVDGGEESRLSLDLAQRPAEPVPPPAPAPELVAPPPQPPAEQVDTGGIGAGVWVAWGFTGALTVAAIGTGVAALAAQSAHQDALGSVTDADELTASADDALHLSIAADVLIGAAVVSGVVSVVVTIVDATDGEPALEASLGPGAMAIRGRF
jgi:PEGA domain-containing protein/tetratricopeptide repeat protein